MGTSEWDWACCWGHASTRDLVHWKHEPIALQPSAKGRDAAGVWSGCSTVDEHGQPVILYTAVRYVLALLERGAYLVQQPWYLSSAYLLPLEQPDKARGPSRDMHVLWPS